LNADEKIAVTQKRPDRWVEPSCGNRCGGFLTDYFATTPMVFEYAVALLLL